MAVHFLAAFSSRYPAIGELNCRNWQATEIIHLAHRSYKEAFVPSRQRSRRRLYCRVHLVEANVYHQKKGAQLAVMLNVVPTWILFVAVVIGIILPVFVVVAAILLTSKRRD